MRSRREPRRSRARALLLAVLGVGSVAGCLEPTEVVVVVDTDATPVVDFMQIEFQISSGSQGVRGGESFSPAFANATPLPATVGVRPQGPDTTFSVVVTLNTTSIENPGIPTSIEPPPDPSGLPPFSTRKVSNIAFVTNEMRALFIPLLKKCACTGTNCPNAVDPDCLDLVAPKLGSFDEDNLPRLPKTTATPP